MARRLYLGHLPPDARSEDINKLFDGYGRIVDCRVMNGKGPSCQNQHKKTPQLSPRFWFRRIRDFKGTVSLFSFFCFLTSV